MKKIDFLNNRDRIINDVFDNYQGTELARILNALIVFEAISNSEATKVFSDQAIDGQYQLIVFALKAGAYRCQVVLS